MKNKVMKIVKKILVSDFFLKDLCKFDLVRELLNFVSVPQDSDVLEMVFSPDQVNIFFTVPGFKNYYGLFAGFDRGKFFFDLSIVGYLSEDDIFKVFEDHSVKFLPLDYFKKKTEGEK